MIESLKSALVFVIMLYAAHCLVAQNDAAVDARIIAEARR